MRQRWTRSAVIACAAVGMGGALGVRWWVRASEDCAWATRHLDEAKAVTVCSDEYQRADDPRVGARLANLLRRGKRRDDAKQLAGQLLATSSHAHAVQVLGKIAATDQQFELARGLLSLARVHHSLAGDLSQLAADDQALAGTYLVENRFSEALRALDDCIVESRAASDTVLQAYCHASAAHVLTEVGVFDGAQQQLDLAKHALAPPVVVMLGLEIPTTLPAMARDLAMLELKRGELEHRFGFGPRRQKHHEVAIGHLRSAIAYANLARTPDTARSAELNLVYSLAELGDLDEAATHLEIARLLDVDGVDRIERAQLEARIAVHRGDRALARSIHERIYEALATSDERIRVSVLQAQVELDSGDLERAAMWATRGVEVVETMRNAGSALEIRPWLLSMRREPYELLFTARARARRFEDALLAFDRWQGRTLFDAIARTRLVRPSSLRDVALRTEEMRRLIPALSDAPISRPLGRAAMIASLGRVELFALLVAHESVWRITARFGRLDMVDLGPLRALKPLLDKLVSYPTDLETADQLSARLLGNHSFDEVDGTLFVLLDGELANLPVAALRTRGRWLIEHRPIVRAARLSELDCVPAMSTPARATVLADSRGDLPFARYEAEVTAARFAVSPTLGVRATSKQLYSAARNGLLHVAMHADVVHGAGTLKLVDRSVSGGEIATHSAGPRMVFLAVCGSAASDDGELATSLAAGFLASGSLQVIATLRPVSDPGAAEITNAFYRNGGVADPARALARAQLDAAAHHNIDWPNFALFGHDICRKASP